MHTGEALYTCPNCPMTFSSSANMYKHRQRVHKAEYAAYKQQCFPPNIIKQAKSGVLNKVHDKQRDLSGQSNIKSYESIASSLTELQAKTNLINFQALAANQFGLD